MILYKTKHILLIFIFIVLLPSCQPKPPQNSSLSVQQIQIAITASPPEIVVNNKTSLSIIAQGNNLEFEWSALAGEIEGTANTAIYTAPAEPGLDKISVHVKDGGGEEFFDTIDINVVAAIIDSSSEAAAAANETATAAANETATAAANETATAAANETATAAANETATAAANETATAAANETATAAANEAVTAVANEAVTAVANEAVTAVANETVTAAANETVTAAANETTVNQNSNIRSGPSTNYKIINAIQSGNIVEIIGKLQDESWFFINYKDQEGSDQEGWIHNSLVDVAGSLENVVFVTPPPTPIANTVWIDNFDDCNNINATGGENGSAYIDGLGFMQETYLPEAGRGCVVKLEYDITWWSAFYMDLNHSDLSQHSQIAFSVRGDPNAGHPGQIKIEIKRRCTRQDDGTNDCRDISIAYVPISSGEVYEYKVVNLASFVGTGWPGYSPVSDWGDIEELVFVVESPGNPMQGVFYLDNIVFR